MGARCLRDRVRLVECREGIGAAVLGGGDVSQPHQVGGHAGQGSDLPTPPRRLLQPLARFIQPTGRVCRDAQVPQRFGLCRLVADLRRELAGPLQVRNGGLVVSLDRKSVV